ncbi:MAG: ATP-binding protein [Calditrichaeota bacterium]|nr:ATP-binding protein [Calditrichota bacterium]
MSYNNFFDILADWNYWGNFKADLKSRDDYIRQIESIFSQKTALTLFGVRRAGKSSLFNLYLQQLFSQKNLDVKESLIINLEDPRFPAKISTQELLEIIELYQKNLSPKNPLIVLDEVQNVDGWEKVVRYLLEAKKFRVIVTGSSSKLLGQEISTTLTGRHVDVEIFPLNFKEILRFKSIDFSSDLEIVKNKIEIQRAGDGYLQWGGFPEIVLSNGDARKRELLVRYFDDIIFKDLAKRFDIKQIHKLEQMSNLLIANIATLQSFNSLKKKLNISLDTVERFARYFQIARMFYFLKQYDYSIGRQIRSIHKVYVSDLGFYQAKGFRFSENVGRIAENVVANELFKRRVCDPRLEIYYWKDNQQREVDFVVKSGEKVKELIQVCWDTSDPQTMKREVNNLIRAGAYLDCQNLIIVTGKEKKEQTFQVRGGRHQIKFIPLWEWMLQ